MNILKCTGEEGRNIIYEEDPNYKIISDDIIDTSRWSIIHSVVVQEKETGKFFMVVYSEGATESQEEMPFEYSDPDFVEVFPVEKTVIKYVTARQKIRGGI